MLDNSITPHKWHKSSITGPLKTTTAAQEKKEAGAQVLWLIDHDHEPINGPITSQRERFRSIIESI